MDVALDGLPTHIHEHVTLAREIWDCWLRVAVPGPAINAGHHRAVRRTPCTGPVSLSTNVSSSTASSSPSTRSLSASSASSGEVRSWPERHRYCDLDQFRPFYAKPRRDPPVPKSAFNFKNHWDYRSEPQTESIASDSRKPLGAPPSGEHHYWPDAAISRSCVSFASSGGIWYTRRGKREFVHAEYLYTSNEGSIRSHNTTPEPSVEHLLFRPDYKEIMAARKGRELERRKAREQAERFEVDIEGWRRAVEHAKPPVLENDRILREYLAEPPRRPLPSSSRTWRPDSLHLWPAWIVKKRSQRVAVELSKRPKKTASKRRRTKR